LASQRRSAELLDIHNSDANRRFGSSMTIVTAAIFRPPNLLLRLLSSPFPAVAFLRLHLIAHLHDREPFGD
jgi:hypothetical protein